MPKDQGALPPLYRPADVAKAIGMSEWWVKEQARRGRIPFTKPGRAYRFTAEQFAEIVRTYEVRPAAMTVPQTQVAAVAVLKKSDRDSQPTRPAVRLRARMPRRAALHQQDAA
ncbi:helix-turn-helix domain-containing protein [Streptomyces sp. NRRL S-350]|uniref:helix-turn-helix domain-containing protein n=1 Tax=Streptomyces sp. NRRL S-350 TaxID=1463902 RepID=UPI0004C04343|nr:helix-turn-helix domain-containing protein [Streptomyces sp. NRRL S-350]